MRNKLDEFKDSPRKQISEYFQIRNLSGENVIPPQVICLLQILKNIVNVNNTNANSEEVRKMPYSNHDSQRDKINRKLVIYSTYNV